MISVIVNVFNGEKYIKKCLDSIINQTYKDLEILIIDDGSTDSTLSICKKYKDKRIRIISGKNIGISLSRNIGLDNARGDYLFFVDSDDYIEKDTIKYLYDNIKKYNVDMATCKSVDVYDYNKVNVLKKDDCVDIISGKEYLKKILLSIERNGNIWGKLMKREFAQSFRFEDRKISDVAVIYKMALKLDKIAYSNQIKYYYLRHCDSIIGKDNVNRSIDYYDASIERYNYIKNIYPDLVENDICVLSVIVTLYLHNKEKVINYLKDKNAFSLYKDLFSLKKIKYVYRFNDRVKLILFRINPKLLRFITNFYLKLKSLKKSN